MTPEPLTVEEVAARLKLSQNTVRAMIRNGKIPSHRIGGRVWRIDPSELQRWLESLKGSAQHEPA